MEDFHFFLSPHFPSCTTLAFLIFFFSLCRFSFPGLLLLLLLTFPCIFSDLSSSAESRSGCSAPGNTLPALCMTEEKSFLSYCTPNFCNASQNESCLPSAALDCCIRTSFVTPINPALSPTHSCLADCYPH